VAVALVVGVASGLLLAYSRGYFPRIAVLAGLAITVLTYMALQTAERLWRLWRPPRD
jgi:hypothetical protein